MSTAPRSVTILILLLGIAWTLPMQTGRHETAGADDKQRAALQFELSVRHGRLLLAGDTLSTLHEQRLRDAARKHFPSFELDTNFRPFGVAPGWWELATLELIAALSGTLSPVADLREDSLHIAALSHDIETTGRSLAEFGEILPAQVALSLQLQDAGPRVAASDLCQRAYSTFTHKPVRFVESGIRMLSSAYPVLDRVAALADACRDATIAIVGHTDSSGNEDQNRQLSEARALAVAEWLATRGIAAGRIRASGVGSSAPLVDNTTRYGRGLNRRIEIRLLAPGAAIPAL